MRDDSTTVLDEGAPDRIPANSVGRWRLFDMPVDRVDMDVAIGRVAAMIERGRRWRAEQEAAVPAHGPSGPMRATQRIVTLNPEMVMAARHDAALRESVRSAALVTADGVGVIWAARLLGGGPLARVTGVDLVDRLAELSAERGYRLFLLGGAEGVAAEAARRLRGRYPGVVIAGTYVGSPHEGDAEAILTVIRQARPDALAVAFGVPAQERWLAAHAGQLGATVAVGVGGALDYIAGAVPRAPRWMRRAGLEWLFRLIRQPWRWRRMRALPRFALAVGWVWASERPRPGGKGGVQREQ
ncbi:MAG TPA: WecB/TagA/CpsF family glycosyltransferase [Ktedonobacterales bacterium]|nr:WecB/TagA/CpsF family glycosyltransferase [Ktedonobacterales bacterium]